MIHVIRAAGAFLVFAASPSLLLSGLVLASRAPGRSDTLGDFLLAATYVGVSTGIATLGFMIPIARNVSWRRLTAGRSFLIAAACGLFSPVASLLVAAIGSVALLPVLRSLPWLGAALFYGLPGLLLGVIAVLVAPAVSRTAQKAHPGAD